MVKRLTVFILFATLIILGGVSVVSAQFTPDVFVLSQPVIDGQVKIVRAVTNEPGWIVIHADNGGEIGPVIGQAPLAAGINAQIKVPIDADAVTDTLYAMLHVDEGVEGAYEFPDGPDVPLQVDGNIISPSFEVTSIENTVAGVAVSTDGFGTLAAALDAAGLVSTLQGEGPFTVFAPTDDAFAALPDGTLDSLLEDTDALSNVLLYHVVPQSVSSGELEDGMTLTTVQGEPLTIAVSADGASVNGVNISIADVEAYNGVIHVIDNVLLPPEPEEEPEEEAGGEPAEEAAAEESASEEEAGEDGSAQSDIVDTAISAGSFETLLSAAEAAGLVDTLRSEGPFTLFAPTDDAFAALPEGALEALLASPDELSAVLLYHVVPGNILSTDLSDGLEAETAQGDVVKFAISDAGAMVNNAMILQPNVLTSNGVIHVIDSVLLPPAEEMMDEEQQGSSEETTEESSAGESEGETRGAGADPTPTPEPTPVPEPVTMPVTGASLGTGGPTLAVVSLVLLAVVGLVLIDRRRR